MIKQKKEEAEEFNKAKREDKRKEQAQLTVERQGCLSRGLAIAMKRLGC